MISKAAAKKLYDLYIGEMVVVYLTGMNAIVPNESGELSVTMMVSGLVLDVDTEFFYLGTPEMITRTISHDLAQMVEIEFIPGDIMSTDMAMPDEDVH
jgi:hypothetical protein